MKLNRLLALTLIALLVMGAMGLLTYRSYARGLVTNNSSECVDDEETADAPENGEAADADEACEEHADDATGEILGEETRD